MTTGVPNRNPIDARTARNGHNLRDRRPLPGRSQIDIVVSRTFEIRDVKLETHVARNAFVSVCDVSGRVVAIAGGTRALPKETRDATQSGF